MSGNSNSGRKNETIERIKTLEVQVANITTEALVDLARTKVFNQVRMLGNSKKSLKSTVALALPVLLKSIKDRKEIEITTPKPLLSAIRGEISEPKLLDEQLSAKADEALKEPTLCDIKPKRHRGFYLKDDQTQYNAITDPITSKEPQPTTQAENEAIMNK